MSWSTRLFHRAPYAAKCVAAGWRGRARRRFRFGPDLEDRVEEALARDAWSPEAWADRTRTRLHTVLSLALERVPFWREHGPAVLSPHDLATWPVLSKGTVREAGQSLRTQPLPPHGLWTVQTSGTTGSPLTVWWGREATRAWYALYEARIRRWNGVSRDDRWGIIGGQPVTAPTRRRPPYWVWNRGLRQLYLSAYHIGPDAVPAYLDAMRRHGIRHLLGYPSALAALATLAQEQGRAHADLPGLAVVVTNAEPLPRSARERIEAFFACPVRDTYGMAEGVAGASECDAGALHLWPDAGIVEVLDGDGAPVAPGETGRLVCTSLLHDAMPLIRYDTGDRGAVDPEGGPCACGRMLPRLRHIEGRQDDVIQTPSGRRVGRLDPVFKGVQGILEAQIEQASPDGVRVRIVTGTGWTARQAAALREGLRMRLGNMHVELVEVERIPRGPRGKFRAVIGLQRP